MKDGCSMLAFGELHLCLCNRGLDMPFTTEVIMQQNHNR